MICSCLVGIPPGNAAPFRFVLGLAMTLCLSFAAPQVMGQRIGDQVPISLARRRGCGSCRFEIGMVAIVACAEATLPVATRSFCKNAPRHQPAPQSVISTRRAVRLSRQTTTTPTKPSSTPKAG